jgi:putative transcriptional regulator
MKKIFIESSNSGRANNEEGRHAMTKASQRKPFFERLKASLQEGIQFAQGAAELRVTVMPAPPPELRAQDIVQLRHQFNLSQRVFARTLNVSTRTVQNWEQGSRRPSRTALRLLQLLGERPEMVYEVVGLPRQLAQGNQQVKETAYEKLEIEGQRRSKYRKG